MNETVKIRLIIKNRYLTDMSDNNSAIPIFETSVVEVPSDVIGIDSEIIGFEILDSDENKK